jgi:hypothetical protein
MKFAKQACSIDLESISFIEIASLLLRFHAQIHERLCTCFKIKLLLLLLFNKDALKVYGDCYFLKKTDKTNFPNELEKFAEIIYLLANEKIINQNHNESTNIQKKLLEHTK